MSPSSFSIRLDAFWEDTPRLGGCHWKFPEWFTLKNDAHRQISEPRQTSATVNPCRSVPSCTCRPPPCQVDYRKLWKPFPSFFSNCQFDQFKLFQLYITDCSGIFCHHFCQWHKINKCLWTHRCHFVSSLCQRKEGVGSLLLQEPASQACGLLWTLWCTYKFSPKASKTNIHRKNVVVFPLSCGTVQNE